MPRVHQVERERHLSRLLQNCFEILFHRKTALHPFQHERNVNRFQCALLQMQLRVSIDRLRQEAPNLAEKDPELKRVYRLQ